MAESLTEVQKARRRVDRLNEQIAAERAKLSAKQAEGNDTVRLADLAAEEAKLQAELEALRESSKGVNQAVKEQAAAVSNPDPTASENEPKGGGN